MQRFHRMILEGGGEYSTIFSTGPGGIVAVGGDKKYRGSGGRSPFGKLSCHIRGDATAWGRRRLGAALQYAMEPGRALTERRPEQECRTSRCRPESRLQ